MTPKSIDDAIKNLQELDKMYMTSRLGSMYTLWQNSVDECYKYLIDRCELFVKQAFRANINETGMAFCIEINLVQSVRFEIISDTGFHHYECNFLDRINLRRSNYQMEGRYESLACEYLIKAFEILQEYNTQLNKFKNFKPSK